MNFAIPLASTSNLNDQSNKLNNAGPPPDLSERYKLKSKYAKLQRKYQHSLIIRKDLSLELEEKEEKLQRLQDEVNLVLDQIYDSDYIHLAPEREDYFSESEVDETSEAENNEPQEEEKKQEKAKESSQVQNGSANGKTRKHESSPERNSKRPRLEEEIIEHIQ